jgi:predicted peroxiredoxin
MDAAEAIRHALGGVTEEMTVNLILVSGGVHAARRGQDAEHTEYASAESGIADCIDMGANVCVDQTALDEEGLKESDLIEQVSVKSNAEIAGLIRGSGVTMIF